MKGLRATFNQILTEVYFHPKVTPRRPGLKKLRRIPGHLKDYVQVQGCTSSAAIS